VANRTRTVEQYVVVRTNGNSGAFVVARDGQITQERYADSMVSAPTWHTIKDSCQCGSMAVTAGHFTSRRDADRAAVKANQELRH
jgi:hypothetical protein